MIEVADSVRAKWERLRDQHMKPSIWLLLVSPLAPLEARAAVDDAASEAFAKRQREHDEGLEFSPGMVRTAGVPDGVVVEIGEGLEDFDELLGLIVDGLARRGLTGRLVLFEAVGVEELPVTAPLVECRLRVAGQRVHVKGTRYRWHPEPDSWSALIEAGVRWCLGAGGEASLGVGLMPRAPVRASDELALWVFEAIGGDKLGIVDCACGSVDRWRMLAVQRLWSRVTLVEAGDALLPDGWRQSVRDLTALLGENAQLLVYALVKHGSRVPAARLGTSLADDWPPRTGFSPQRPGTEAFEDSYAPDAFATQLLGPGYVGRVPSRTNWRETPVGHDRVLLEHAKPEQWFETPFAPLGGWPHTNLGAPDGPDVLLSARADFAHILFTDDLVKQPPSSNSDPTRPD